MLKIYRAKRHFNLVLSINFINQQEGVMPIISWPEMTFGPVNLYSLPPAWFFYLSAEEKMQLVQQVKQSGEVIDPRIKQVVH